MSLEDIMKSMTTNTIKFQQEAKSSIQNLENQVSQMATAISRLESQNSNQLPSQTVINPKENASAILLRSGKEINQPVKDQPTPIPEEETPKKAAKSSDVPESNTSTGKSSELSPFEYKPFPPFSEALAENWKYETNVDLYETFLVM